MGLVYGNSKLGKVWNWSIPAIKTCPGSTALCRRLCYAHRGFYRYRSTAEALDSNFRQAKLARFTSYVIKKIHEEGIRLMRVHASGDFFNLAYAEKWYDIFKITRTTTHFWFYTRSWRIPPGTKGEALREARKLRNMIKKIAKLPNVSVFLSADKETGQPPAWPKTRVAYLMMHDDDVPKYRSDLMFRDNPKTVMQIEPTHGVTVCPVEQGVERETKITCETCRLCHRWNQLDHLNKRNLNAIKVKERVARRAKRSRPKVKRRVGKMTY